MIKFKVDRKNHSLRAVACRVAMCIGVRDPLAWEEGDDGPPFWIADEQKFQLDPANDYWLRRDKEELVNGHYTLHYRHEGTPHKQASLQILKAWLECDLAFGE